MKADAALVEGSELHLYVVEFEEHGVKVGVTRQPDKRLAQHRRDAAAYGRTVGLLWLSGPHVEARSNEAALKRLAGPGTKREYLPLGFDEVATVAEALPKSRVTAEEVARQKAKSDALFQFLTGGWVK